MSEKKSPSPHEERRASEKKLRKREKKLINRLFEAHEDEADAWVRLKKAEARLEKRKARVQRIKNRLEDVRGQLVELRNPAQITGEASTADPTNETELTLPLSLDLSGELPSRPNETLSSKHSPARKDDDDEDKEEDDEDNESEEDDDDDNESEEDGDDDEEKEFAEYIDIHIAQDTYGENAALTGEEAEPVKQELPGTESYEEASVSPAEAEKMARQARAAAEAAEQAARLAAERAREITNRLDQVDFSHHLTQELSELEAEAKRAQSIAQETGHTAQVAEQLATEAHPSAILTEPKESPPKEKEVAQESADIDTVAAMIIADAAAIAAAEAEAVAEVSSARVRDARKLVRQADEILEQVRTGIGTGTLVGEESEILLQAAERDNVRARTALAEAEAAEAKAQKAAFTAEAEAEIAALIAFTHEQEESSPAAELVETSDQAIQTQEEVESVPTATEAEQAKHSGETELQETEDDRSTCVIVEQPEPVSTTSAAHEEASTVIVDQTEPVYTSEHDGPASTVIVEQQEMVSTAPPDILESQIRAEQTEIASQEELPDTPIESAAGEKTVEQQEGTTEEAEQSEEVIVEIVEGEEQGQFVLKDIYHNGNEIYLVQEEHPPEGEVPQDSPFRLSTESEKETGDPTTAQKGFLVVSQALQTTQATLGLNGKHSASPIHEEDDREATIKMPAIRVERSQEPG